MKMFDTRFSKSVLVAAILVGGGLVVSPPGSIIVAGGAFVMILFTVYTITYFIDRVIEKVRRHPTE